MEVEHIGNQNEFVWPVKVSGKVFEVKRSNDLCWMFFLLWYRIAVEYPRGRTCLVFDRGLEFLDCRLDACDSNQFESMEGAARRILEVMMRTRKNWGILFSRLVEIMR